MFIAAQSPGGGSAEGTQPLPPVPAEMLPPLPTVMSPPAPLDELVPAPPCPPAPPDVDEDVDVDDVWPGLDALHARRANVTAVGNAARRMAERIARFRGAVAGGLRNGVAEARFA